jgi:transcriptional regulator with XRE-family HTH domain
MTMAREELVQVPAVVLGSRLRAKRKALRLSQHQLGGDEFSPSYVSAVERGKIRPSLKALYILADRLGEPVTYFLQDEGAGQAESLFEDTEEAASIDISQGRPQDAIAKLLSLSLAGYGAKAQATVYLRLGQAYIANQQPAEAIPALREALRLAETATETALAASARLYQGIAYYRQQRPAQALEYHRHCLQSVKEGSIKGPGFALLVYDWLGRDLAALGQEKDALPYCEAAMKLAGSLVDLRSVGAAQWEAASAYKHDGSQSLARVHARRSLAAYEALTVLAASASVRTTYAAILSSAGKQSAAESALREAEGLGDCIGDGGIKASASIQLGQIAGEKKQYTEAERLLKRGIEEATALGERQVAGEGDMSLAQVYTAQNRRQDAERCFQAGIAMLAEAGASEGLSKAYFRYGQALVAWGESSKGSEYLEKAYLQTRRG